MFALGRGSWHTHRENGARRCVLLEVVAMTPAPDGSSLRSIFDEAAELYDRARPGYPTALFDDLAGLADLGPGRRVLEIGCGTGQASVPLAARGCALVCVELGPGMAAV